MTLRFAGLSTSDDKEDPCIEVATPKGRLRQVPLSDRNVAYLIKHLGAYLEWREAKREASAE